MSAVRTTKIVARQRQLYPLDMRGWEILKEFLVTLLGESHVISAFEKQLTGYSSHGDGTTSAYYFYTWRFGWVFYIMALFFGVLAVFTGLVSCTRLGSGVSSLLTAIATFWMALAAILMT
jgi:hypothetical protein